MRVRSFCVATLLMFVSALVVAQEYQDLALLEAAVSDYLNEEFQDEITRGNEVSINVSRLDPRLRLQNCDKPLTFTLRDTGNGGGNLAVRTQCIGDINWSIYVSAKVALKQPVYVANHNLPRGTVITEGDIISEMLDTSTLGQVFATDPKQLVGKELTRTIGQGQPVRLTNLTEPKVIARGDAVIVEAQSGAVMVASTAVAMSDGRVGEQIRVRNEKSQRDVRVVVLGPGRVRANL